MSQYFDLFISFVSSLVIITSEDRMATLAMDEPLDLSCRKTGSENVDNDVKINLIETVKSVKSEIVLNRHVKSNKSLLPCEICRKNFDRPSLLKRHLRTHTGEKPHVCETCNKGFSTSSSLNTHRRIHSGLKPHVCAHCGKRFTASSNLYYHRMTHTKIKPHKCTVCTKSFPTPGDLRSHMYVHSGCWPFRCTICSRGFSKQTNLRNHYMLHTGDKPHVCKLCHKRFALPCNLKAHLKLHHTPEDPPTVEPPPLPPADKTPPLPAPQSFTLNTVIPDMYRHMLYEELHKNLQPFRMPYMFPTFEHNLTFHLNQNVPK